VKWKDGSTIWESLNDLKESNPVEFAEHAVGAKLVLEPAFAWWVPFTLKRRDGMIGKINACFARKTHKFGIAVPSTVKEALQMDKENGNTVWWDSIQKEMKNVQVAFNILDDGENLPPGHTFVKCHVVFHVKMDLTRKSSYVADGHVTDPPSSVTCASVASGESVCIVPTLAALNGLEVLSSNMQNACLTATAKKRSGPLVVPSFTGNGKLRHRAPMPAMFSGAAWTMVGTVHAHH
jgi:hypothetical protein